MTLRIIQGHRPIPGPSQINIVIDVIRAFTVAHYAFIKGVEGIVLAGNPEEAFRLKQRNPEFLLAGEIGGLHVQGFDLDNSPERLTKRDDLEGKYLIQMTTNGVKATLNALNADCTFVTGFSNAKTTAEFIKSKFGATGRTGAVNIIASHPSGDDDLACAQYMAGILRGLNVPSADQTMERIRASEAAQKFYDVNKPEFLAEDISLCAKEISSDFVMKVNRNTVPLIEKVRVEGGPIPVSAAHFVNAVK
ncbi:2-phosphosulfolactate phosphatase [Paenibacillus sp. M1]|uniref:Probable 2-phosphosulfolactate phosphatase n=1 Tax=Paenibacillus haidiansis TaxID=1574488 RepID=A0ABU7VTZ0_9BACL